MEPGAYDGLDISAYHSGDGVSNSDLKLIEESPADYIWYKNTRADIEKTKTLDFGSAIHCLILEPHEFDRRFIVAPEFNRRTLLGKEEEKEFLEKNSSKTIITSDEYRKLIFMRDSTLAHPVAKFLLESDGISEKSIYWRDSDTDVLCRCRPDKIIQSENCNWIIDLKSTSDISRFHESIYKYRYFVQDAFYSDGYASVFSETPSFTFIAISSKAECGRYPVHVVNLDLEAKAAGRMAYKRNLQTYAECMRTGEWSGIRTYSLPYYAKELKNEYKRVS